MIYGAKLDTFLHDTPKSMGIKHDFYHFSTKDYNKLWGINKIYVLIIDMPHKNMGLYLNNAIKAVKSIMI